jgi:hypothetical protein
MKSWRTTISAAVTVTGTALVGVGGLTQLNQLNPNSKGMSDDQMAVMWYIMAAGFVLSAIGKGLGLLFAADATVLKNVVQQANDIATQTNVNTVQIADTKAVVENQLKV